MQVIVPVDLSGVIADAEIIVEMRAQQPAAVNGQKIFAAVIAQLMAAIPAKTHRRAAAEGFHQRGEIFLALGILKSDLNPQAFRLPDQAAKAL